MKSKSLSNDGLIVTTMITLALPTINRIVVFDLLKFWYILY